MARCFRKINKNPASCEVIKPYCFYYVRLLFFLSEVLVFVSLRTVAACLPRLQSDPFGSRTLIIRIYRYRGVDLRHCFTGCCSFCFQVWAVASSISERSSISIAIVVVVFARIGQTAFPRNRSAALNMLIAA